MRAGEALAGLAGRFRADGHSLLVAGASARHLYLGKRPAEWEAWTTADLVYVARECEGAGISAGGAFSAVLAGGGLTVKLECDPLSISRGRLTFSKLKEVCLRRAFTADALLYDPLGGKFIDPLGCLPDIRNRLLRGLNPADSQPPRKLRALFQTALMESDEGFAPLPSLTESLRGAVPSWGREEDPLVRDWLDRVFTSRDPRAGISRLDQSGVLAMVFPEVEGLKGCPQDKDFHPEGDVFQHTLECFARLRRPSLALAISVLLHDVGKPATISMDKYALRFPQHASVGAALAGRMLGRLGYPADIVGDVRFLVKHHLLTPVLRAMTQGDRESFFRHPLFPALLRLYLADVQGSFGDLGEYRAIRRKALAARGEKGRGQAAGGRG